MQLPETNAAATRARVIAAVSRRRVEAQPSPDVRHAIDGIIALLAGEPRDLTDIAIDDDETPDFNKRVYAIARKIPPGETMTYGEIAERLGDKLLARAVGQALGRKPDADRHALPSRARGAARAAASRAAAACHQAALLTIEGAQPSGPTLFDALPLATRGGAERRARLKSTLPAPPTASETC